MRFWILWSRATISEQFENQTTRLAIAPCLGISHSRSPKSIFYPQMAVQKELPWTLEGKKMVLLRLHEKNCFKFKPLALPPIVFFPCERVLILFALIRGFRIAPGSSLNNSNPLTSAHFFKLMHSTGPTTLWKHHSKSENTLKQY